MKETKESEPFRKLPFVSLPRVAVMKMEIELSNGGETNAWKSVTCKVEQMPEKIKWTNFVFSGSDHQNVKAKKVLKVKTKS